MTDKTQIILKILAAVVITLIYAFAAISVGIISVSFSNVIFSDLGDVLKIAVGVAISVLIFTFIDCRLFDTLYKLFEHSAWVYAVISGNFLTIRGILFIIIGFDISASFGEIVLILFIPTVASLLGGTLFCFLIRLFKNRKAKRISESESAKEYAK